MSTRPPRPVAAFASSIATLVTLALLLGTLLPVLGSEPPAAADPPTAPDGTHDDAHNKLLLVFDSSGSMKEADPAGTTKIDAARAAFTALIPRLPDAGRVGLRVYGATVFYKRSPGACTDSQLAVPVGRADKPALKQAVAGFRPYGETPLSYSLLSGAKDLGGSGKRTILLVSDGEETCDPDPCATARRIAGLGIDLKIDVVGFRVKPGARKQLRCIADAGSGTFYETDDARSLSTGLRRLSVRAFRPFRVSGHPVAGTADGTGAPVLTAGQYVDSAPEHGETKYYRIRRSMKGSTLHIGASARPAPGNAVATLHLETKTPDGDSCGYGLGTAVSYARTNPVVTASASSWDPFTSYETGCQDAPELIVTLEQADSSGTTLSGVPVEIVVVEEPPVTRKDELPPQADSRPRWTDPPRGAAKPVTAGASFSDAPVVGAGHYATSLFPGEVQFVKVRLGWGQRLEAEVRAPRPSPTLAAMTDSPQVLEVAAISPTRGRAMATLSDVAGQAQVLLDDDGSARARTTTVEVRYANRDAGTQSQQNVALPGDYYVAISLGEDRDGQTYLVPVLLSVAVVGVDGARGARYAGGKELVVPGPDG
ncbi:MAG TPA: hypothetical protein VE287_04170, partial [Actinopolymorphaceae bacterium]|nr:hypothetical protein [Actinopolymorphaceae bacterium]